jgi:predicted permease
VGVFVLCYIYRVVVGGGKPIDALQLLVVQPVLWAALLGLSLNALRLPLPGSVAAVAAALAPANKALMLLSAGMLLQPMLPQPRQVRRVWHNLGVILRLTVTVV